MQAEDHLVAHRESAVTTYVPVRTGGLSRAGLATLRLLEDGSAYDSLESTAAAIADGLSDLAKAAGIATVTNRVGSMFTTFFHAGPAVVDWESASASDTKRYGRFFHGMLDRGVYLAPSQYEAAFVGLAHTDDVVDFTLSAAASALAELG